MTINDNTPSVVRTKDTLDNAFIKVMCVFTQLYIYIFFGLY